MNDERLNPLKEVVATVAFSMPEEAGQDDRTGVLFHVKVDTGDKVVQAKVYEWLLDAVQRAGGEPHWDLCGPGDTTE
jgi:hypothetical protein